MEIRKMSLLDLDKISNELKNFDDFWTVNIFKTELNNPNCHYVVVIDNNKIIGFGGISIVLDEANLNNIAVRIDKRNNKIGSLILKNLIDLSKSLGSTFMTLEVNVNNINAIKLYEKFGFKNLGFRKNYYNGNTNAYIMTLKL